MHRSRIEGRSRNIPGLHEIAWSHVEFIRNEIEPLSALQLTLDAIEPAESNLSVLLRYIDGSNGEQQSTVVQRRRLSGMLVMHGGPAYAWWVRWEGRMTGHIPDDVSPAGRDLREYTDELRPGHAVVRNDLGEWVLLRHELVRRAALDDVTFSSGVSRFVQVPNGLDGAEHSAFAEALSRFLHPTALAPYEAGFERIAADLVASLPRSVSVEAVGEIGALFAVRAQSAWLGWPAAVEGSLLAWIDENRAATRSGDLTRTARVADDFDDIVRSVLALRRRDAAGSSDVTDELLRVEVGGRRLTDAEVVSVLRNWTGGDLGSIALCIGVLVHHLAADQALQSRLRAGVADAELELIIDEILRIDDPFVSNRRVTTDGVLIGGVQLPEGARVKLHWTSANRDEAVFGDPDGFDPAGNAAHNLVYGIGRHACPGRSLATLELRLALRALLAGTSTISLDPEQPAVREVAPVGGWASVPVLLH